MPARRLLGEALAALIDLKLVKDYRWRNLRLRAVIATDRMIDFPQVRVVMALPAESAGVFEAAAVPVLYCGVGKVNAAIALTRELRRYVHAGRPPPLVLNFGSAGSRVHVTGTLLACHEFVQRDMDASGLGFALGVTPFDDAPPRLSFEPRFAGLPAAICGSGDSFARPPVRWNALCSTWRLMRLPKFVGSSARASPALNT